MEPGLKTVAGVPTAAPATPGQASRSPVTREDRKDGQQTRVPFEITQSGAAGSVSPPPGDTVLSLSRCVHQGSKQGLGEARRGRGARGLLQARGGLVKAGPRWFVPHGSWARDYPEKLDSQKVVSLLNMGNYFCLHTHGQY